MPVIRCMGPAPLPAVGPTVMRPLSPSALYVGIGSPRAQAFWALLHGVFTQSSRAAVPAARTPTLPHRAARPGCGPPAAAPRLRSGAARPLGQTAPVHLTPPGEALGLLGHRDRAGTTGGPPAGD